MTPQLVIDIREYLRRKWSVSRIMFVLDCSYDAVLYVREIDENMAEAQEFLDGLRPDSRTVIRARWRELEDALDRATVDPKHRTPTPHPRTVAHRRKKLRAVS